MTPLTELQLMAKHSLIEKKSGMDQTGLSTENFRFRFGQKVAKRKLPSQGLETYAQVYQCGKL